MIFIYKELIKKYINTLTTNDIKNFAHTKNETISDNEAIIIKKHIMTYQDELLKGNTNSFQILKQHLRSELFNKITLLYNEYYKKYKKYLQN